MTCTHEIQRSRWVEDEDDRYGAGGEWEYWAERTTEDIDLHRYRCTQCGEVMYYSGRARDHYEGKKPDPFIHQSNRDYVARRSVKGGAT